MLLSVERPHRGSLCRWMSRGHAAALYGLVHAVLPASDWNMCKRTMVVPQELGRTLFVSSANSRLEIPGDQLQALAAHSSAERAKATSASEVPPSEGNEVRRDGGRASQHPHSTDEAGELVPQDPVEGRKNRKGVPDVGTWAGNYVRGFVLGTTYHRHDPG